MNLTIAASAPTSARDVTVTNPDTGTGTGTGVFTVTAPPSVVSITSTNGDGKPVGDTIVVTFSAAIDPASVCNTWAPGANSTTSTTTQVILTKNASGHDTLKLFDSASCTFQVFSGGSLDLGTTGYVTTAGAPPTTAIFGNASKCNGSSHCSVVAINAADTVLTITLGDVTGTVGTVAVNPGITYTPDPALARPAALPTSTSSSKHRSEVGNGDASMACYVLNAQTTLLASSRESKVEGNTKQLGHRR